ncbi:carboxypeptidase-like regulatory domain-containing protein [Antarcticibacterium sp. 1MA-6-2]|uniref:carboxypeptidase-like regulatory domain-containing protein n=1 Tax=Antarcticibacterium sp. 1MA-6-2 TaxID=2908210 RepID=UPI001F2FB3DF|nr:carboxypeptidase-like regulatory domain-containing protein [Antarcticibacterium sp. 1MA-6-2]UJH90610.1 carboxypeptidase-like regulatory domain-containing protein [Antarcticibacterium sp. 1MA-6-2]
MKKTIQTLVLILFCFTSGFVSSQELVVKGIVKDTKGMPLPGASVVVKGTSNGTITDFDGNFGLQVSQDPVILQISFLGFQPGETIADPDDFQEIVLTEDTNVLNEVVVTALGIKREEKRLGFSQASIDSDNLNQTVPTNWSSGLKGKVARFKYCFFRFGSFKFAANYSKGK